MCVCVQFACSQIFELLKRREKKTIFKIYKMVDFSSCNSNSQTIGVNVCE